VVERTDQEGGASVKDYHGLDFSTVRVGVDPVEDLMNIHRSDQLERVAPSPRLLQTNTR